MDNYVVKKANNGKGFFFYYKNGQLHREAGPAIVFAKKEDNNFGDHDLYKEELIGEFNPYGFDQYPETVIENPSTLFAQPSIARYYLEGRSYSKIDFEEAKQKLVLKNELNKELETNQSNKQKNKI